MSIAPAAQDHLAPRPHRSLGQQVRGQVLDTCRAAVVDRDPLDPAVGPHLEVRPAAQDRVQVRVRRGHPGVVRGRVDLEPARTVGDRVALVVAAGRQPRLRGGLEDRHAAGVVGRHRADVDRAVAPVVIAGAVVGLQPLDQRPAVRRAPALAAHRRPLVEVLLGRPERDAGVVRRAAAEHLRAGVAQEAVALLLRLDRIVPVVAGVEQVHPVLEAQDRAVVDVGGSRLQQAHGDVRVFGQPGGDDASCRAAAGDHIVELARVDHGAISPIGGQRVELRARPRGAPPARRDSSSPGR